MTQSAVKAFIVAVLPRRPRIDLYRLDAYLAEPELESASNELGTIIGSDIVWL